MFILRKVFNKHQYLTKAVGETLLVQLFVLATGVAILVLRVKALGVEQFGNLVVLLAVSSVSASLLSLGLPRAVSYFVAKDELSPIFGLRVCVAFYVIAGVVFATLSSIGLTFLEQSVLSYKYPVLLAVGFGYPLVALKTAAHAVLLSISCIRAASIAAFLENIVLLFGTAVLVVLEYKTASPFLVLTYFSIFLGWGFGAAYALTDLFEASAKCTNNINMGALMCFGISQNGVAAILALQSRLDLFAVRAFLGEVSAGFYAIALQIADKANILVQSFCSVYRPFLTIKYRKNGVSENNGTMKASVLIFFLTSVCSVVGILGIIGFSSVYKTRIVDESIPIIAILCWGVSARAASRVANVDCHARGDLFAVWFRAIFLTLLTSGGILIGIFAATPIAVAIGVAMAQTVDAIFSNILNSRRRRTGLEKQKIHRGALGTTQQVINNGLRGNSKIEIKQNNSRTSAA